jgi:Isochorismatase family
VFSASGRGGDRLLGQRVLARPCRRMRPVVPPQSLSFAAADALTVSGSETDVCAVLGAIDLGYRVIVVRDAVCNPSDEKHKYAHAPIPYSI